MIQAIATNKAPCAIGPYSQAVVCHDMVFVSGQIALDAASGQFQQGTPGEQTRVAINNLAAILEEAGSGLDKVVKTTVYLKDMQDFQEMNRVYAELFGANKPARATVAVASLPRDAAVEIEAIATRG